MSEQTAIEWATHTFNPWIGCTKVSPGCAHCYAEARDRRLNKGGVAAHWGPGKPRQRTSASTWRNPVKWNMGGAGVSPVTAAPLARARVFPSLCDWLDDEVPIEWLADFLQLIHDTPNLDWLLLTKRPENFSDRVGAVFGIVDVLDPFGTWLHHWLHYTATPPGNIWIGTSVEDQQRADERIPAVLKIPAAVRFLSVEPLLGPVDIAAAVRVAGFDLGCNAGRKPHEPSLDWVIVGGESGPGARACNVDWIRDVARQCKGAGVPCFVKQLGSKPEGGKWPEVRRDFSNYGRCDWSTMGHPKGGDPSEWPDDLRVREFPGSARDAQKDPQDADATRMEETR